MSLKDKIERELDVPVRLRAGAPGSLVVLLDGKQIYSKKQSGGSPGPAEIIQMIRAKVPPT